LLSGGKILSEFGLVAAAMVENSGTDIEEIIKIKKMI